MSEPSLEGRLWQDWTDPDFFMEGRHRERRIIPLFMRQILPKNLQRTKLTLTGWMLIFVAMGIGSAAYNTASNILFMTLSLLLSSLVLSGILSLINFKKLSWSIKVPEHFQVDEPGLAEVRLKNQKRIFPSMSIAFSVGSSLEAENKRLYLQQAISAGENSGLEWSLTPKKRGRMEIYLHGLESKFPFGFIMKGAGQTEVESVLVWPARVDYEFAPDSNGRRFLSGASHRKAGMGSDLLNLRPYERGDPPRLVHWKATARLKKLMIRQLAQEGESGFNLLLNPSAGDWTPQQFEKLCSLACALAEDLFHLGRLENVQVAGQDLLGVRSLRELHEFFDSLAELSPSDGSNAEFVSWLPNITTFKPCGESGVAIYVNGIQTGQTID